MPMSYLPDLIRDRVLKWFLIEVLIGASIALPMCLLFSAKALVPRGATHTSSWDSGYLCFRASKIGDCIMKLPIPERAMQSILGLVDEFMRRSITMLVVHLQYHFLAIIKEVGSCYRFSLFLGR